MYNAKHQHNKTWVISEHHKPALKLRNSTKRSCTITIVLRQVECKMQTNHIRIYHS